MSTLALFSTLAVGIIIGTVLYLAWRGFGAARRIGGGS